MERWLVAVSLSVALAVTQTSRAADAKGQFGIRGAGLVSCKVFNHERNARSPVYDVIAAWMDGYITGTNQHARDTFDAASFQSTELYAALVSEYCNKHPDTPIFPVINSLVKQTWNSRLRAPSKKVEVAVGDQKATLYEETVKRIQEKLARRGFYRAQIGTGYGPAVQEAMKSFQKSIQFKPTGFPDQATLWQLFNDHR